MKIEDRMTSDNIIPFNKCPFFGEEFAAAIQAASHSRHFSGDGINSNKCYDFLSKQYGYERSLLTPSCTAALEMAALLLDLGPGDEVIVPSYTFVTSANAFALRGVTLVFADSETDSPNASVCDILKKVTEKTKAIVVVHYAGIPIDVGRIIQATNNLIPIVEDCAHAIHDKDPKTGDYIGKLGSVSTFSFHQTKNVGIGEGGLLVVNDKKLWSKAQVIREKGTNRTEFKQGNIPFYTWVGLGSSYLMSDVDAAMLWSALQHVDQIQSRRLAIWDKYSKNISYNPIFTKPMNRHRGNAHMYFMKFDSPDYLDEFCRTMGKLKIGVAKHYVPLHSAPFITNQTSSYSDEHGSCLEAIRWSQTLVRLPLYFDLLDEEQDRVINSVNSFTSNIRNRVYPTKSKL